MCFDSVLSVKSLQVDYHIGKQKTELIKKKKYSTMGDTHDVQFKGVGGWKGKNEMLLEVGGRG